MVDGDRLGDFQLKIEETTFSLREYNEFLQSIETDAIAFKTQQQSAFEAERDRWAANNLIMDDSDIAPDLTSDTETILPPDSQAAVAPIPASVWQVLVEVGATVSQGDSLVILECMKMEMTITAPIAGKILEIRSTPGQMVSVGQILVVIQESI